MTQRQFVKALMKANILRLSSGHRWHIPVIATVCRPRLSNLASYEITIVTAGSPRSYKKAKPRRRR